MQPLKSYYPFSEFRPGVEELLDNIDANNQKKYFIIRGRTGCHAPGTNILMFDGTFKKVEDVEVGDLLMGPDSRKRQVLQLFSGQDDMYKITPHRGGRPFVVNKGHILSLISTNAGASTKGKKFTGKEIVDISVDNYLAKSKRWKHLHKLYRVPISFDGDPQLTIQPYFLGLLLGDESIDKRVGITTIDPEIKDYAYEMAKFYGLLFKTENKAKTDCKSYILSSGKKQKFSNPITNELKSLNLYGCVSDNKFIPHVYKTSSIENRYQLLAGIIDTDGSLYKNCIDYLSKSKRLAEDVAFVARSLGLCVHENEKFVNGTCYHRLSISGDIYKIPVKLNRKKGTPRKQIKRAGVSGFALSYLGKGNYYGFMLDEDHRYLLDDFTVTHNSGKSGIAIAISREKKCHILTATKLLQDQYANTPQFNSEFILKGKSNYNCTISGGSTTEAPCSSRKLFQIGRSKYSLEEKVPQELRQRCAREKACEYYTKKYSLGTTSGGILNYDLAFSSSFAGEAVVLDEAHNFIDKVLDFYSLEIPTKKIVNLLRIKDTPNQTNYVDWLKRVRVAAAMRAEGSSDSKTIEQCKQISDRVGAILQEARLPGDFYVDCENDKVQIKPIYPATIAHKFLSRFGQVYFLSATIDEKFASILGLDPEQTVEFNLDSTSDSDDAAAAAPPPPPDAFHRAWPRPPGSSRLHRCGRSLCHRQNYRDRAAGCGS